MSVKEQLLIHEAAREAASVAECERDTLFDSFQLLQERVEAVMSRLGHDHPEYDNLFHALVRAADDTTEYLKGQGNAKG